MSGKNEGSVHREKALLKVKKKRFLKSYKSIYDVMPETLKDLMSSSEPYHQFATRELSSWEF